ncbi:hypothetical protein SAMN04489867_1313 [Pedococcus dokdonensis]|uniref:Uncharacterized protein n=1 Tax=Pedococcus dokdonensis TaxID=443156 RepID=A0A1H0PMG3_9MICO|nr:hypothetical protein [Pedococcus dokdonensis]SDP06223.1 hypothetical protein SAMN04489867_1313 [Pedococcus dokdonensis]
MVRTPELIASPDGRHAVRKDITRVAVDETPILPTGPAPKGLFGRSKATPVALERRYGLCYQMWEVDPLRFVGRVVVAWLSVGDMPDGMGYFRDPDRQRGLTQRQAYWDAIAGALLEHGGGPDDDVPPATAYPSWFQADPRLVQAATADLDLLVDRWGEFAAWQPDGQAFWVRTNGFHSCVGLDGVTSPGLWLERKGLMTDTWVPCAQYSHRFEALPGRRARETFDDGSAILDGAPSPQVMHRAMMPVERDEWVPTTAHPPAPSPEAPDSSTFGVAATLGASATASSGATALSGPSGTEPAKTHDNRLTVMVPAWTATGVTEALDALAAQLTPELAARAEDGEVELRFVVDGAELAEGAFFDKLGLEVPEVLPALRRLVDTAADAMARSEFLYSDGAQGVGLLSRAVRWVGVLDVSALPTVMAYGEVVDAEHEYTFVGETVPGIVNVHGWTDETIDFAFWVMVRNYFNGLQDFDEVWSRWHLRGAVTQRDPVALAQRVVELNRDALATRRYAVQRRPGGLEQLAADIPQPHEPWAATFFAAAQQALMAS